MSEFVVQAMSARTSLRSPSALIVIVLLALYQCKRFHGYFLATPPRMYPTGNILCFCASDLFAESTDP